MKRKYYLLMALFLISLASALILTLKPIPPICEEGCDLVRTSKYATITGIKNSIIGIFAFIFISILTYLEIKNPSKKTKLLVHIGIVIAAIIALLFIYLQFFVIKSLCAYCLVVDFSMLIALGIAISMWRK